MMTAIIEVAKPNPIVLPLEAPAMQVAISATPATSMSINRIENLGKSMVGLAVFFLLRLFVWIYRRTNSDLCS